MYLKEIGLRAQNMLIMEYVILVSSKNTEANCHEQNWGLEINSTICVGAERNIYI